MLRAILACAGFMLVAAPANADELRFDLHLQKAALVQLRVARTTAQAHHDNWSQALPLADLSGLGGGAIDQGGPVAFRLSRPAGTLACQGTAHDAHADGRCTLTPNADFTAQLAARGIGRPTEDQSFELTMSGVSLDVPDALRAAGWERPSIAQLVELGIFHVTASDVRALAEVGYKNGAIKTLVEFAIFHVTPDYIRSMRAAGLDGLSAATLVQLRIFKLTPQDARAFAKEGRAPLSAQRLVDARIAGSHPQARGDDS
ncbi:MAG: hypothetical protein ABIS14_04715 [Sphingomonas sp.]